MASSNKTIAKLQKTAKSKYADLKEKAKECLSYDLPAVPAI